jgi:hypothetical protein
MKKLTITVRKLIVGHDAPMYQLRDNHDRQVGDEGYLYETRAAALAAAENMYPRNSVWDGKRTRGGWQITID